MAIDEKYPAGSKYYIDTPDDSIDVYEIMVRFGINHPAIHHAVKKLLMAGKRGNKSTLQDWMEAREALDRAIEMESRHIAHLYKDPVGKYFPDEVGYADNKPNEGAMKRSDCTGWRKL